MAFKTVRKVARELALDRAIHYVAREPEKNVFVLLDFAERMAVNKEQKRKIRVLREHMKDHPPIMEQTRRLAKNPKMLSNFMINWVGNHLMEGARIRDTWTKKLGVSVPHVIVIDPTTACNLQCGGCWAGAYGKNDSLEPELLNRILKEARELGIYWIVLSGGEPMAYPYLADILAENQDMAFMAYTNGTLIDDKMADTLAELGNFSPAFSLEGWEADTDGRRGAGTFQKVMNAMDLLRERGVFFGVSVTATRQNYTTLFSHDFVDFLVTKGAVYMWSFHYVPVGRDPDPNLMLTAEERAYLAERVPLLRKEKPILIADFWNDGGYTRGCIAGGRLYFHINGAGDVEPCAFAHFATDTIREKSLQEVLKNPLFQSFQRRYPFHENDLAPCPIIDTPENLRQMVKESGAHPTHPGAEKLLCGELAQHLDCLSASWRKQAELLRKGREQVYVSDG